MNDKQPVLLTWSDKKTSKEVCDFFQVKGVVAAEEYETINKTPQNSESYGPGWTELKLMIHEDGTINCVGGERESSEYGDTFYKGALLLEKYWKVKFGYSPR